MKNKICTCINESAPYFDFGAYRCQYCDGVLNDLNRVRKIIDFNTPVSMENRQKKIDTKLEKHTRILMRIKNLLPKE